MKDTNIVITGGAGFIGSTLARELSSQNKVTIIDNLSTGKLENIEALPVQANVRFVHGSILDSRLLAEIFTGQEFIFHLAAIPSVARSMENPVATNEANITGTLGVLVAAREARVRKLVFSTSSSVYGNTEILPKHEGMPSCPMSPYALSKMAGEYYCEYFTQYFGLPTICLRYFNVYGPGQDPVSEYAAVIPRFIQRVGNGEAPVIFGDGENSRDFTFVSDAVRANILAAESECTGVFNIGSGRNNTILQLARMIIELSGKQLTPLYEKERSGDVKDSLADITKARAFGYFPEIQLREGLTRTIQYMQNN